MTAEILTFPTRRPKPTFKETKYKLDTEELINSKYTIRGKPVEYPKDQTTYLKICKRFMEEAEYKLVLLGIMDSQYFEFLRPELKNIVACYYELGDKKSV